MCQVGQYKINLDYRLLVRISTNRHRLLLHYGRVSEDGQTITRQEWSEGLRLVLGEYEEREKGTCSNHNSLHSVLRILLPAIWRYYFWLLEIFTFFFHRLTLTEKQEK